MASDQLTNKAAEILGQLQSLSPKAVDAALGAARVDAYSTLVSGVTCIAAAAALCLFFRYRFLPWAKKQDDSEFPLVMGSLFGGTAVVGLVIFALCNLLDPWTYVTIVHPELWVAHQLMQSHH